MIWMQNSCNLKINSRFSQMIDKSKAEIKTNEMRHLAEVLKRWNEKLKQSFSLWILGELFESNDSWK